MKISIFKDMFGFRLKKWIFAAVFLVLFVVSGARIFPQAAGAVDSCSFSVFRSQYGDMFDARYWQNQLEDGCFFNTGIYDDASDFALAANFAGMYFGVGYNARIMNHKRWPHNLTDMDVRAFAGIPSLGLGIRVSYFDKNVYDGIGTAAPKIEIGKNFARFPLSLAFEASGEFHYWKGLCLDVVRLPLFFKADFSSDGMRGFGGAYGVSPVFEAKGGVNNVSSVAPQHDISFWAGWFWEIQENLRLGFRPNFSISFNCVNTADYSVNTRLSEIYVVAENDKNESLKRNIENLNWIPENGNTQWRVSIPFSVVYDVSEKVQLVAGFKWGFYWANFDHMSSRHTGGCNLMGTVNETGFALGMKAELGKRAVFQIGTAFVRQLSLNPDGNTSGKVADYEVESPSISLSNLFDSPLAASLTIRF